MNPDMYYVVQIKSGPKWGNSSQHKRLAQDFETAIADIQAENPVPIRVQPVLGICYGKARKTTWKNIAIKVEGQSFWHLISENPNLYTDIIEPLGYRAQEHTQSFEHERDRVINRFTQELLQDFCTDGMLDWVRILEWNSKNLL